VRVGKNYSHVNEFGLSVAPSGKAVICWWRAREPERNEFQYSFTVRVRTAADAPWGPAQRLSRFVAAGGNGDVAINNDGTGMAAWSAFGTVRRSRLMRSGAWTAPWRMDNDGRASAGMVEVESTPAGFTAIKWVRLGQNGDPQTVVALHAPGRIWSRQVVAGLHGLLAVGPAGKVIMVKDDPASRGLQVTWRSKRSRWRTDTLAPPRFIVEVPATAVDATGRIFVPWSRYRHGPTFMSTNQTTWRTTTLWDRTRRWRYAGLPAAAVSRNGRAVAIRTVTAQYTRYVVAMRVFRPG
jgi:hypothetical protein